MTKDEASRITSVTRAPRPPRTRGARAKPKRCEKRIAEVIFNRDRDCERAADRHFSGLDSRPAGMRRPEIVVCLARIFPRKRKTRTRKNKCFMAAARFTVRRSALPFMVNSMSFSCRSSGQSRLAYCIAMRTHTPERGERTQMAMP